MAKVFFSYASEDRDVVDQVVRLVKLRLPHHAAWIDRYEIVGGDDLLAKIAEGMDAASKFFIFLSPVSVTKRWVNAELRRAIMREISEGGPEYIVPVKIGDLRTVPAFLEHKHYIDLPSMTADEWLASFDAAITGTPLPPSAGGTENFNVALAADPAGPHALQVHVSVTAWAEPFGIAIDTTEDLAERGIIAGPMVRHEATMPTNDPRRYAVAWKHPLLTPGEPVVVRLAFAPGVDAQAAIANIARYP
jgi:hypothetical protein